MRLRLRLSLADLLTIGNGLMGFNAILTLTIETEYFPEIPDELAAAAFIALGLAFDALDGIAARRFGSSMIGPDLDSMSDLVTFCVAPAVLLITVYGPLAWYPAILVASLVVVFGMARLARFNSTVEKESRSFNGLPTPLCASAIVLLVLFDAVVIGDVEAGVKGSRFGIPVLVTSGLLAFLMISNIAYPKARERFTYLVLGFVTVALVVALGLLTAPGLTNQLLLAALALTLAVVAIGPVFTLRGKIRSVRSARRARRMALAAAEREAPEGDEEIAPEDYVEDEAPEGVARDGHGRGSG